MQPIEIKALELEQSALKFLDGVIADYGLYIFMVIVFVLIPLWRGIFGLQGKITVP